MIFNNVRIIYKRYSLRMSKPSATICACVLFAPGIIKNESIPVLDRHANFRILPIHIALVLIFSYLARKMFLITQLLLR